MAGKAKFNQEAVFQSIIGLEWKLEPETLMQFSTRGKVKDRGRCLFFDRGIDKALRRMALEEGKISQRPLMMFCIKGPNLSIKQKSR